MAEQIRRLDYVRRSKSKSLMKSSSGIQNIKKECSTQIRAANEMEDRKKNLSILRNEIHKRTFVERHDYEVKMVECFKNDLDVKSQKFNNKKFQELRSKSAGPRLENTKPDVIAPEKTESKSLNYCTLKAVLLFKNNPARRIKRSTSCTYSKQDRASESMRFLHPSEFRRHNGQDQMDGSDTFHVRSHTAQPMTARARRQSAAANGLTAYIPRDVKSAPPRSRSGYTGHVNEIGTVQESGSRSYRLLKDAFKKRRKELPNPSKDRLDKIKTDHTGRAKLLNERIKKRFNDIFEEDIFRPIDI